MAKKNQSAKLLSETPEVETTVAETPEVETAVESAIEPPKLFDVETATETEFLTEMMKRTKEGGYPRHLFDVMKERISILNK